MPKLSFLFNGYCFESLLYITRLTSFTNSPSKSQALYFNVRLRNINAIRLLCDDQRTKPHRYSNDNTITSINTLYTDQIMRALFYIILFLPNIVYLKMIEQIK